MLHLGELRRDDDHDRMTITLRDENGLRAAEVALDVQPAPGGTDDIVRLYVEQVTDAPVTVSLRVSPGTTPTETN